MTTLGEPTGTRDRRHRGPGMQRLPGSAATGHVQNGTFASRSTAPDTARARDSYGATAFGDVIDRSLHAAVAHLTAGPSPVATFEALTDWGLPFDLAFCVTILGIDKFHLDLATLQTLTLVVLVFNGQAVYYVEHERRRL